MSAADDAEDGGGGERHERLRGERGDDVLEEAVGAGSKDVGLALFSVIALDDADSAERLGEAAGDFGVDLGALAEDGADGLEGFLQDEAEDEQDAEGEHRHLDAELDEVAEGEDGGEDAAEEVDDAGADEVAYAFDVGHDAGDEGAGAVFVVEGDGEAADVGLDLHAQLSDEALALFGEQLREGVGGNALDRGWRQPTIPTIQGRSRSWWPYMTLSMRVFVEAGQNEAAGAVDDHQEEAAAEQEPARLDELPDLGQDLLQLGFRARLGHVGGRGSADAARGAVNGFHAAAEFGWAEGRGHG